MLISTSHVGMVKGWNKEVYAAWSSVTMPCYSTWSSTFRACLWDMLTIQWTGTTVSSSEIFQETKLGSVFILNLLNVCSAKSRLAKWLPGQRRMCLWSHWLLQVLGFDCEQFWLSYLLGLPEIRKAYSPWCEDLLTSYKQNISSEGKVKRLVR